MLHLQDSQWTYVRPTTSSVPDFQFSGPRQTLRSCQQQRHRYVPSAQIERSEWRLSALGAQAWHFQITPLHAQPITFQAGCILRPITYPVEVSSGTLSPAHSQLVSVPGHHNREGAVSENDLWGPTDNCPLILNLGLHG